MVQAGGGRSLGMVWRHREADGLKTYLGKKSEIVPSVTLLMDGVKETGKYT